MSWRDYLPATRRYVDKTAHAVMKMQDTEMAMGDERDEEAYELIATAITDGTIETLKEHGE